MTADTHPAPIRRLTCCCCGDSLRGRQWWNRDIGYGICTRCADEQAAREDAETMRSYYGIRGRHYAIEQPPTQEN